MPGATQGEVRAVMVGCGSMSAAWLRAAAQLPELQIVGLVDISEDSARRRQAEFGLAGAAVGTSLEAVLDATAPDAVFDCTVPEAHSHVALAAIARGCHVLGEKPLADSMERAREAVVAAAAAGRIYAVIQNRRYDPRIRRMRRLLDSGAIGRLTTLNSDFYIGAHFGGFRDRMRNVLLLDMAIHSFDQARYISGADPVSVWCRQWNPAGSWYDHDASAIAVFEMTGGLVYSYRGSWCSEGLNTSWECDWRAIGTRGSVTWDGGDVFRAERVRAESSSGFRRDLEPLPVPDEEPSDKRDGHLGLIREFVACVLHGGVPETAASDNIKSLAMVFGAIESARTGEVVRL